MRQILLVAMAISLLGIISISAHDGKGKGHMGKEHFKKIDTDGDGKISKDEWQKFHESKFTEMDKDTDGSLSEEEIQSFHKEKRKELGNKGKGKWKGKGNNKEKEEEKKGEEDSNKK
jgi:Ca2+-binding EF-hand superfamily protein